MAANAETAQAAQTEQIRDSLMGLISMAPAGSIFEDADTEEFRADAFNLRLGEGGRIYTIQVFPYGAMSGRAAA